MTAGAIHEDWSLPYQRDEAEGEETRGVAAAQSAAAECAYFGRPPYAGGRATSVTRASH
jgi:hypothetical protein